MFTSWLVALADDPACVLPVPARAAVADAVSAATGSTFAARTRLGMVAVPTWLLVSVACHGRLLEPGRPRLPDRGADQHESALTEIVATGHRGGWSVRKPFRGVASMPLVDEEERRRAERAHQVALPEEVLDLAAALKRENPPRSAVRVVRILQQHLGWDPSYRTVHRHLQGGDRTEAAAQCHPCLLRGHRLRNCPCSRPATLPLPGHRQDPTSNTC